MFSFNFQSTITEYHCIFFRKILKCLGMLNSPYRPWMFNLDDPHKNSEDLTAQDHDHEWYNAIFGTGLQESHALVFDPPRGRLCHWLITALIFALEHCVHTMIFTSLVTRHLWSRWSFLFSGSLSLLSLTHSLSLGFSGSSPVGWYL